MSSKYLMGLDAGGSGGRCLLVEVESGQVVVASRSWTHRSVPGTGGWGFDLDLGQCWALLSEAVHEAMEQIGATPDQVLAIAVASMRHTAIVLDREIRPVLSTPNRDARASAEGMGLAAEYGSEFHQRTGHWPSPIFAAARLRWLAVNNPAGLGRATTFLSLSDWLNYRMCGRIATEASQAGETLLFDLETRDWAWDLIELLDLPRQLFPPIRQTGSHLGDLSKRAANALGLKSGTPVAVGGADTQCGLLGVGSVAAGQMGAIAGTNTPVQLVVNQPLVDPDARMWTSHHVIPNLWVLESNAGTAGDALEWCASAFYPNVSQPLAWLSAEAAQSVPGAIGILSNVGADVMNASQMTLPTENLTMTHIAAAQDPSKRRHLARAILEGMAYALRANAEQILSVAEKKQPSLGLAGGMAHSSLWTQIVSNVLNVPVDIPVTTEATALGAAICAGVGAGVFRNLSEGAETLARIAQQHEPDPHQAQTYQGLYASWTQLRETRATADDPLLVMPNIITTPHANGNTVKVGAPQEHVTADAAQQLIHGEEPHHSLNPEATLKLRGSEPRESPSPEALTKLGKEEVSAISNLELKEMKELKQTPSTTPEAQLERTVGKGLSRLRSLRDRLSRKPASAAEPPANPPTGGSTKAQMERVLRAFVTHAANDPALQDFSTGQKVTMHYVVSDLGIEFYTSFHDGQVAGDMGAPPVPAQVRLKMKANVLDDMFTGRINATRAVMTGKISFSGDTRLAMEMQRIQKDLNRLYTLARKKVGAGDLDLTPALETTPPPTPAATTAASAIPSPSNGLREQMVKIVTALYTTGLITATGGNVSARIPGTDHVLITPSQLFKGDLRPGVLVRIDMKGKALDPDALSPSSEWPMHNTIYQARPDVEAIIHTHAPQVTILGLADLPFTPISTEAAFLGDLPRIPFIMPGTNELAQAVMEALGDGVAVLMQNHGLTVAGSSLRRAAILSEIIERTSEVILGCYAVGKEPPTLPESAVAVLREMGKMMA
ncbi:MAG: hypothetical protein GY832_22715 [Chloroflexi bacterium]|nr:hypothetical protein [Chloroflexota bacterium]